MGQGLSHCLCGAAAPPRRLHAAAVTSEPFDEGLGHSFCYVRPDHPMAAMVSSKVHDAEETTTFRTISGASVSANTATPLSTSLLLNELTWPAAAAFESSISIAAVPLQPVPRLPSGPIDRGFLSGPIERGFMSGPLDPCLFSGPLPGGGQLRRSLSHVPRSRRAAANLIRRLTRAITRTVSKDADHCSSGSGCTKVDGGGGGEFAVSEPAESGDGSLHWAQGKAGEDRVHVVISEEHGWVFVGIYDGFNGPDATDYLLSNLYSAVQQELKGLLWEEPNKFNEFDSTNNELLSLSDSELDPDPGEGNRRKRTPKKWEEKQRQWRSEWERERLEMDRKLKEQLRRPRSAGANHAEVLKALSKALMRTEEAYLETADEMVAENPELALMGSCVLVMLMKGEDVYLLNVGDSRAVLAQKAELDVWSSDLERISEEGGDQMDGLTSLVSLQLSRDHSTNIEEEVIRIRKQHRDDPSAIANDRVKGSLKVTRAFGAGFLKQPKWNGALLEMFRIDYVGTSPYITCNPSLYHHKLGPKDRFLILSSGGLYQYLTNEEAVAEVELFIEATPEGDPAQHLVEEVLFRAANKAGMDFHELLEIPQGDRRRYHDDVSIIVISLEGRIWRSCL